MPKTPFHFEALRLGSSLAKAIQKGAVVVGRAHHERIVPAISAFSEQIPFEVKMLTSLRNQKMHNSIGVNL